MDFINKAWTQIADVFKSLTPGTRDGGPPPKDERLIATSIQEGSVHPIHLGVR